MNISSPSKNKLPVLAQSPDCLAKVWSKRDQVWHRGKPIHNAGLLLCFPRSRPIPPVSLLILDALTESANSPTVGRVICRGVRCQGLRVLLGGAVCQLDKKGVMAGLEALRAASTFQHLKEPQAWSGFGKIWHGCGVGFVSTVLFLGADNSCPLKHHKPRIG